MTTSIEKTILSNLLFNPEYCKDVFPYMSEEYFQNPVEKKLFDTIASYIIKYNEPPSKEALSISISNREDLNENTYKEITELLDDLKIDQNTSKEFLRDETEKFCQDRAIYNSIMTSINILDGKHKTLDKGSIPQLLTDALSISFDTYIGHDLLEEAGERWEYLRRKHARIPMNIAIIDEVTKGGWPRKSLVTLVAGSGVGKSLIMCHNAASALIQGYNVLYISMELSSEEVSRRIDANLIDTTLDDMAFLSKEAYVKKIDRIKENTKGKLIVKDYPTGSASAAHFRHLLNELKLKKNFTPDIIFVDYLNICASSKVKGGSKSQYEVVKFVAEELRALSFEFDCCIVTASQLNRSGYSSDPDATNISESLGILFTSDAVFAVVSNEELEEQSAVLFIQLKNRWGDINIKKRFLVGIDRSKMKLFNLETSSVSYKQEQADKKETKNISEDIEVEFSKFTSDKRKLFNMDV